ncbi:MAG: BNR-4 repeat-containing protein [Verrucomicrobiales bacterium]|nr:BNR-4 repeat-containing protein [Verrucomicrobiales bacterium]
MPLILVPVVVGGVSLLGAGQASPERSTDPPGFTVFLREGGWCWFQNPRAILQGDRLFIGGMQGNGEGAARVGVYDLRERQSLGTVTLRDRFDHDDHNAPALHVRPDGSVLAVYALHGRNRSHYYRISDPGNPLQWSDPMEYRHDYPTAGNVTYMNLHALEREGKLYNFFRGIEFNPSFITSTNHGLSWGEPTHFIASELPGRQRPYALYVGNGCDTVHVCFTDAHPNRFGNSIYYAAFRAGAFHRADGRLIKNLGQDGPLRPSEAESVFAGGGRPAPDGFASAERSAWPSSLVLDAMGHPHIGYSVHLSDADHRFRIASWDGVQWHDREVAYAGHCLYDTETSYTGLISLDPVDPSVVVIATDVDPRTGRETGGTHEIYRAGIGLDDDVAAVKWVPVTRQSSVRNLRPLIVSDGPWRVILWNRGDFRTYTDYRMETVGMIEKVR